jgi:hypothetical protein
MNGRIVQIGNSNEVSYSDDIWLLGWVLLKISGKYVIKDKKE